jgi:hypothetical protein
LVNKFVFAIAGIVIAMTVLIALPNIYPKSSNLGGGNSNNNNNNNGANKNITIEYNRQNQTTGANGLVITRQLETLAIDKDGQVTYTKIDPNQKNAPSPQHFTLGGEQFSRIKSLILETGFLDIPNTDYPLSKSASNFVEYTLSIAVKGSTPDQDRQKTISWAQEQLQNAAATTNGASTAPAIITNIQSLLDDVISKRP